MTNFYFMAHQLEFDGYGYASIKIGEALERQTDVIVVNMADNEQGLPAVGERSWWVNGRAVALCVPDWWEHIECERLIGHTMFESTKMPEGRIKAINAHSDACLVPCQWCKESFEEQGVRVPVYVVKWGVDPRDYYPLTRNGRDGAYTFLWSGTPDWRKGWDVAYKAFLAAFGKREDVHLILHFRRAPMGVKGFSDPNVTMIEGMKTREGLRRMLHAADCFVFPSRGEGWGLPPREAAATGLPVIATSWGGLAEDISHWALPLHVKAMVPAEFGFWDAGTIGDWAEPDLDHLVEHMRWCADNPEAAATLGRVAAQWLQAHATWDQTAQDILAVIEEVWTC